MIEGMPAREERPWAPCRLMSRLELAMGRPCPRRRPAPLPQWIWEPARSSPWEPCGENPPASRWAPAISPWMRLPGWAMLNSNERYPDHHSAQAVPPTAGRPRFANPPALLKAPVGFRKYRRRLAWWASRYAWDSADGLPVEESAKGQIHTAMVGPRSP